MTRRKIAVLIAVVAVFIAASGGTYANRGNIRDWVYKLSQPKLPEAVSFDEVEQQTQEATNTQEPITETPTKDEAVQKSPTPVTPPEPKLATEIQLDVPFLLQAPKQNWVDPFEDACEEASLLMVDAYYNKKGSDFTPDEGIAAILGVTSYEDRTYGHNKDTTTEEVAKTAINYFGFRTASIQDVETANDIKKVLSQGHPVIVPAYGKALGNPNFRNGGPDYHMLVIKGYTADGYFITNDPGTRNGKGYLYKESVLMNALHELYPGNMQLGKKRMIVVEP